MMQKEHNIVKNIRSGMSMTKISPTACIFMMFMIGVILALTLPLWFGTYKATCYSGDRITFNEKVYMAWSVWKTVEGDRIVYLNENNCIWVREE